MIIQMTEDEFKLRQENESLRLLATVKELEVVQEQLRKLKEKCQKYSDETQKFAVVADALRKQNLELSVRVENLDNLYKLSQRDFRAASKLFEELVVYTNSQGLVIPKELAEKFAAL